MLEGRDCIHHYRRAELEEEGIDSKWLDDPAYIRAKGNWEEVDLFDASFFDFTPAEAEITDPQQRLFLECAWEALESAGYCHDQHSYRVGIFGGAGMNTYLLFNLASDTTKLISMDFLRIAGGNDKDHLATRTAFKLNLFGPSVTVQSSCSTALTAACLAADSLKMNHCDIALAGGVSVGPPRKEGYIVQKGGIFSPSGKTRPFSAVADGFVPGGGVGIVVLKRLQDALQDHDTIYAVIKGYAMNNDGSQKSSYNTSNIEALERLFAAALENAGIDANTIDFIETNASGNPLSDYIELTALTRVHNQYSKRKNKCAIGSVKANIGHCDTASGAASLIKASLSLYAKRFPPSLECETNHPLLEIEKTPFYTNGTIIPLTRNDPPLRAGVTSLGMGGANVHLILEEPPPAQEKRNEEGEVYLALLSAKSRRALFALMEKWDDLLTERKDFNLEDIAYTLQKARKAFPFRWAALYTSQEELHQSLVREREIYLVSEKDDPPVQLHINGKMLTSNSPEERKLIEEVLIGFLNGNRQKELNPAKEIAVTLREPGKNIITLPWRDLLDRYKTSQMLIYNLLRLHWLGGSTINWSLLYKQKPYVIPLPTHPFLRKSYWRKTPSLGVPGDDRRSTFSHDTSVTMSEMKEIPLPPEITPSSERKVFYVASVTQNFIYQNEQKEIGSFPFHFMITFSGSLDYERLDSALKKIINRHEILRTSYLQIAGKLYQKINPHDATYLAVKQFDKKYLDEAVPFRVTDIPLVRMYLKKGEGGEYFLHVMAHPIAFDLTSAELFFAELCLAYRAEELPPLSLQYKDVAEADPMIQKSDYQKARKSYREKLCTHPIPEYFNLFTSRSLDSSFGEGTAAAHIFQSIEGESQKRIEKIVREEGRSIYSFLCAVLGIALFSITRKEDITFGVVGDGRWSSSLSPLIGHFGSILPFSSHIRREGFFIDYWREVAFLLNGMLKLQYGNGYETLEQAAYSCSSRAIVLLMKKRNPHFSLRENLVASLKILPNRNIPFILSMQAEGGRLEGQFSFRPELIERTIIEKLAQAFFAIITTLAEAKEVTIEELDILANCPEDEFIFSDQSN